MANLYSDSMLTRDKGAAALSNLGYPVTKATLATLATRGGGPPYQRFGKRVLYRWENLLSWAEERCTVPRTGPSIECSPRINLEALVFAVAARRESRNAQLEPPVIGNQTPEADED